ncbi:nucleotidyltransferase family protein [Adonisia turfae]|uniref:Nucleotidyltransferase domain-containing protein n=1 Tax=Adonisia turfae CCMR0081 TaxID=2292702 RepID=A0A6M0RH65_9CYAN|nr:nucleotidyltransferase domain-containing protein [Adonisia turfae]NEZ54951.1 nucleotidyltransferase domain-containing protein [Adonisia turfae CCMR0081]
MAKTALELTPEEWKQYTVPKRQVSAEVIARWEKAWELIPELTALLRNRFGATQVKVFGSAIKADYFSLDSDIDLVAWGIPSEQYYDAFLAVMDYSEEFKVDLVNPGTCRPWIMESIEEEGIEV